MRCSKFLLGAVGAALLAAGVGAGAPQRTMATPIASAFDESPVSDAANNESLANAVTRWNRESPETGPGEPDLSRSEDLLVGVGVMRDTLSAFPTTKGAVCYEILAAGTCARIDTPSGISFAILSTRNRGTRLFGVASDRVSRVQVVVDGEARTTLLRRNGFHFQLPDGSDGSKVQRVISTLVDGSTHTVNVHD